MPALRSGLVGVVSIFLLACEGPTPAEPGASPANRPDLASAEGRSGPVVFHSARSGNPLRKIYLMAADGSDQRPITSGPGNDLWPDLSPDGRFVTFVSNSSGNNEIYVMALEGGVPVNVSNHAGDDSWPRWSPNGQRIAFHSNRDGDYNLFTVTPDGAELHRVTSDPALDQWPDWSPDGRRLAFRRGMDIYTADVRGVERDVRQLTFLPATLDQMPAWSPNGQWIAFMSLRDGYPSVFLMSASGDTPAHPAVNLTPKDATDPAAAWLSRAPAWSRNGRQIYFMSFRPSTQGDVEIFAVHAELGNLSRLTNSVGEDGGPRAR